MLSIAKTEKLASIFIVLGCIFAAFYLVAGIGTSISESLGTIFIRLLSEKINIYYNFYNGLLKGIATLASFVPIVFFMFVAIRTLELSRIMLKFTNLIKWLSFKFNLPANAVVPMIIGFGCNIPVIGALRKMIPNKEQRIVAIMMTPFMSCSGRIAIYAAFLAALPSFYGPFIIFSLYLLGILVAFITGAMLKVIVPKHACYEAYEHEANEKFGFNLEILVSSVGYSIKKTKNFIMEMGKMILPLAIIFEYLLKYGVLKVIGVNMAFLFYPIGFTDNNWPEVTALLSGIFAKEVVIGMIVNFHPQTDLFAVFNNSLSSMYAFLVFVSLYFPCLSVMISVYKELGYKWTIYIMLWSTILAYGFAVILHACLNLWLDPIASITKILIALYCISIFIFLSNKTFQKIYEMNRPIAFKLK